MLDMPIRSPELLCLIYLILATLEIFSVYISQQSSSLVAHICHLNYDNAARQNLIALVVFTHVKRLAT